jgi:hypothetical protein
VKRLEPKGLVLLALGFVVNGCGPFAEQQDPAASDGFGQSEMDLKLGGTATASSVEASTLGAANAVDGSGSISA